MAEGDKHEDQNEAAANLESEAGKLKDVTKKKDGSSDYDGEGAPRKTGKRKKIFPCSTPAKKVTITELRQRLQKLGLPTTGRKAELESDEIRRR